MNLTNHSNLPGPLVRAVEAFAGDYADSHDKPSDISVTSLIDAPQPVYLKSQHYDEIEEDVADRIWALMGAAIHLVLERAEDSKHAENRVYADWDGWVISGMYDHFKDEILSDYKMMSVWEAIHGLKPEKTAQLNVMKWLLEENGQKVDTLQIVSIYRDWQKSKAKFDASYPQFQVQVHDMEVWSKEETEAYISERIAIHKQARESGKPAPCSREERWAKDDVFAVMVKGLKRAKKLHDHREHAETHAATVAGAYVEHRKGESVRCESYCSVSKFCPQFQEGV